MVRWLLRGGPRIVRAVFDDQVFGVADQVGRPGVISGAPELREGRIQPPRYYDVSCPGCGYVAGVSQAEWPFSRPPDGMTCRRLLRFRVCCGWTGWLWRGRWVGR